jgi:hypothetical protein
MRSHLSHRQRAGGSVATENINFLEIVSDDFPNTSLAKVEDGAVNLIISEFWTFLDGGGAIV